MKKWAKNPWVLGIGTTVIGGVLLSLLLDWIQGIDWLSTFKNVMRFIFNGVVSFLNFEISMVVAYCYCDYRSWIVCGCKNIGFPVK